MRAWYSGRASGFQPDESGSTPDVRSISGRGVVAARHVANVEARVRVPSTAPFLQEEIVNAEVQTALRQAARALPKSADGIAGFLGRVGVKGKIGCEQTCVLANYFAAATGRQHTVVDGKKVTIYTGKEDEAEELASLELSSAASELIDNFDGGLYPWLAGKPRWAHIADGLSDLDIVMVG